MLHITRTLPFYLCLVVSCINLSASQTTDQPKVKCRRLLDLMFVLDGSNSLGMNNFELMINTVADAVDILSFGPEEVRVGAVLYSTSVSDVIDLQTDQENFTTHLRQFAYPDDETYTNLGMYEAVRKLIANKREEAPIAMMIVTDGQSTNKSATEYATLVAISRGVDVWAIGVGELVNVTELANIATNGIEQTFMIESFDLFQTQLLNLTRLVCEEAEVLPTVIMPNVTLPGEIITTTAPTTSSTNNTGTNRTTPSTNGNSNSSTPSTNGNSNSSTPSTNGNSNSSTPSTNGNSNSSTPSTNGNSNSSTPSSNGNSSTPNPSSNNGTTTSPGSSNLTNDPNGGNNFTTPSGIITTDRDIQTPTSFAELCEGSPSKGGVGYVTYPGDCTMVLQCYYNPNTSKTLVVTRHCPVGMFWDQTCLECRPSYLVDCPYDKCRNCDLDPVWDTSLAIDTDGKATFPMGGRCGSYWICEGSRSSPRCCPPGQSYKPGVGCLAFGECFEKCGVDSDCNVGIGVCEKLPIWENVTSYYMMTQFNGQPTAQCLTSNFSIPECRCLENSVGVFMTKEEECMPYYSTNTSRTCAEGLQNVPIQRVFEHGLIAFHIRLNLTTPSFDMTSASSALTSSCSCHKASGIRIWGDKDGIYASLGDKKRGPIASTLFKNATGEMDILVMLHEGVLTLATRQGNFQHVASVKASSANICTECTHTVGVSQGDCQINKLSVYNCKPQVSDIYDFNYY